MLTLTLDPAHHRNPWSAARALKVQTTKLLRYLRARYSSERLEWLWVMEEHKSGWPHAHVLMRGPYVPWQVIRAHWRGLTGAEVTDIRSLTRPRQGGSYVAKYVTKAPDPFGLGRTYWKSAGFLTEPMRPTQKRYCTLGELRVFEGRAWDWLAQELDQQRIVEVQDSGLCVSVPWAALGFVELVTWLIWQRAREAVQRGERPPPNPRPLLSESPWADRPKAPDQVELAAARA